MLFLSNIVKPMYIQELAELIVPYIEIVMGIFKNIIIIVFYKVVSMLVTLLKLTYVCTRICVFVLTVFLKLINFVFQVFSFFIPHITPVSRLTLLRLS